MNATGMRIDAHVHVWDRSRSSYEWLDGQIGQLGRNFSAGEAEHELRESGIDGAVLVQADDTERESDYLLEVAHANGWVRGVVGWIPLDEPGTAESRLEQRLHDPLFRGVRQLIHDDPRPDVLGLPAVRTSLALVAAAGLPFDVPNAWPRHLQATIDLAKDMPGLMIVLDHLGKPPRSVRHGQAGQYEQWLRGIVALAELPNTVAKLSGLRVPGVEYSAAALRPTWDHALELFGAERLMYGGDWPMTVPDGGYAPTLAVLDELSAELSHDEQRQIFADTALRVYDLTR